MSLAVDGARGSEGEAGERLAAAAHALVPRIRQRARAMEAAGRLDDALVDDMEAAGLFSVVVPGRWGGAGLGPHELNRVVEILGGADCSTAWVTGFYNLHNWFLCRFPLPVQEQLYAGRSCVRAAAVFSPPATARRVPGGYRITGRWGYATGILHASHALVPALVDDAFTWMIVPREQLQVFDDWDVTGMVATGSVSIAAREVFVAEAWTMETGRLLSAADHAGTFHEEEVYRFPFSALTLATASLYLGALDAGVELARQGLARSSGPASEARIERPAARIRWVRAYETARVMRLVRDAATREAVESARCGRGQTPEEEAHTQLHIQTLRHTAKDTLRELVDADGSSGYRQDGLLRRLSSDIAMLSTHALHGEHDVVLDRYARWLLGLGPGSGDSSARLT